MKFQLQTIRLEYKILFSIKTGFFGLISNADRKAAQILARDIKVSLKLVIAFLLRFLIVTPFFVQCFLCRMSVS